MGTFGKTLTLKPATPEIEMTPQERKQYLLDGIAKLHQQLAAVPEGKSKKPYGLRIANLMTEITAVNKLLKQPRQPRSFFINAAKAVVPNEVYQAIWEEAKRRHADYLSETNANILKTDAEQGIMTK